jgi:hypothetical protein
VSANDQRRNRNPAAIYMRWAVRGEHRQMSRSADSDRTLGDGRCVSATAYGMRRRRCSQVAPGKGGRDYRLAGCIGAGAVFSARTVVSVGSHVVRKRIGSERALGPLGAPR